MVPKVDREEEVVVPHQIRLSHTIGEEVGATVCQECVVERVVEQHRRVALVI